MGIHQALVKRFSAPEYALLFEVADSTGYASRYADAIAMSLWKSRGLSLHGIEVKVARSDWLRELKDPAKSAPIQKYCDHWWIVATKDVVKVEELPPTWGLLVLQGESRLFAKKKAPVLEPEPMSRKFLAALLRRASEVQHRWIPRDSIKDQIESAHDRGVEAGMVRGERKGDDAVLDLKRLKDRIESFENVSGVKIANWNAGNIASKVALATSFQNLKKNINRLCATRDTAAGVVEWLDQLDEEVRAFNAE